VVRIVGACALHYGLTIGLAAALCVGAVTYAAAHIAIDTDTTKLISADVPWRQRELAFDAAFPQRADLIAIVVDATTAELAERATARLTERLTSEPQRFRNVWRPDGGIYFDREGLLLQPTDEVARTTQALIAAQPMLGAMAADPSLRGLMDTLSRFLQGVSTGSRRSDEPAPVLDRLATALEAMMAGGTP